jgi:radical SAM protein with 4Fe4S-binding SPASM domain
MRVIEFNLMKGCPINCYPFCPQKRYLDSYKGKEMTTLDDFKLMIKTIPSTVTIDFAGFSEPFLNPEAIDMMEYAHERGHPVSAATTLVGLTPEGIARIAKLNPVNFLLHLPDAYGIAHIDVDQNYKDTLIAAFKSIHVNPNVYSMNQHFISNGRAGNCDNSEIVFIGVPIYCSRLEEHGQYIVNPNGDVSLCCMDWSQEYTIGNILTSSYNEICNSEKLLSIKKMMETHNGDFICRHCTVAMPRGELSEYLYYQSELERKRKELEKK